MRKYIGMLVCLTITIMMAQPIKAEEDITSYSEGEIVINEKNFPDPAFRGYLQGYFRSDVITQADIQATTYLGANNGYNGLKIKNLKGIEYFTELRILDVSRNELTSLDLSKNTKLSDVKCDENLLTSINLTKNTDLKILNCEKNELTELDVLQNKELKELRCYYNQLKDLNVSQNTKLTVLGCGVNQLTTLDVTKNTKLTSLGCYNNQLTSLDLSQNTELEELKLAYNQLVNIDLSQNTELLFLECQGNELIALDVSKNTKLKTLVCDDNQIKDLDVSKNPDLNTLWCQENQITILDISNNMRIGWFYSDNQKPKINMTYDETSGTYKSKPGLFHINTSFTESTYTVSSSGELIVPTMDKRSSDFTLNLRDRLALRGTLTLVTQLDNSWIKPLTIGNWTYGETPKTPSAEAAYGSVEFSYSDSENGTFTSEVPQNAGTWYVKAYVPEEDEYGSLSAVVSFTIEKATPLYTIPDHLSATYGNTLESITLPEGFTWMDKTQPCGNAGIHSFYVKYTPQDTQNYKTIENIEVQVNVKAKGIEHITVSDITKKEDIDKVIVKDNETILELGKDYDITYEEKGDIGYVHIILKGNYAGTIEKTFVLKKQEKPVDPIVHDNKPKPVTQTISNKVYGNNETQETESKAEVKEETKDEGKKAAAKKKETAPIQAVKEEEGGCYHHYIQIALLLGFGIYMSLRISQAREED